MVSTDATVMVRSVDRARILAAVGEFGLRPSVVVSPGELAGTSAGLAVIDPELLGATPVDGLRVLQQHLKRTPIVFLAGPWSRESLALFIGFPDTVAIVPRDATHGEHELRTAVRGAVAGPQRGWEGVVGGDADQMSLPIVGSASRDPAVEALTMFFEDSGVRSRKARVLVAAAEELITNAVYDAPVDADGEPLYASLDRRSPVQLAAGHHAEVRAAADAQLAAVSVSDPFGALRARTVRRFLSKGLRGGADQIDAKMGGAGLGLTRIFGMSDRLIVRIWPGQRTELLVVVHLRGGRRDAKTLTALRIARAP